MRFNGRLEFIVMRISIEEKIRIASEYIKDQENRWVSPTTIGAIINGGHSSVGSPVCKTMVERGIAERNEKGHYRLVNA